MASITVSSTSATIQLATVGPAGATGPAGTQLVGFGAWTAQTYQAQSFVSYQGSSYISNAVTSSGDVPGVSGKWVLAASKGDTGAAGTNGAAGATGSTGAAGAQGSSGVVAVNAPITNSGTSGSANLSLSTDTANGVPLLDSSGLLKTSQLPALALVSTNVVASQAAMLALTAQSGDVAVRTDLNKTFILTASPASTLGNWQELLTPTDAVTSVAGRTGAVTLAESDITNLTSDLAAKAAIASPTLTGTPAGPTAAVDTNTTQLATTAFVVAQASSTTPANDGTAAVGTSTRYARADHVHNSDSTKVGTGDSRLTDSRAPDWVDVNWNTDAAWDLGAGGSNVTKSTLVRQTGTLTASRTVTLPLAASVPDGSEVIIAAGSSVTSSNTVVVARAGSDTINGSASSVTVGVAYGMRRFFSNGSNAWTFDAGVLRSSNNLNDVTSVSSSLTNLGLVSVSGTALSSSNKIVDAASPPAMPVIPRAGEWFIFAQNSALPSANQAEGIEHAMLMVFGSAVTISSMAVYMRSTNAASTGAVVRLGIRSDNASRPGNLVYDAGTVSTVGVTNGWVTIAFGANQTLSAYTPYWFTATPQGAPSTRAIFGFPSNIFYQPTLSTAPSNGTAPQSYKAGSTNSGALTNSSMGTVAAVAVSASDGINIQVKFA